MDNFGNFDLQAERGVAGSVLIDTDAAFWPEARSFVQASDFTSESCRRIWTSACKLLDDGKAVDTLTVIAAAGVDYNEAMAMLEACPTAVNVCEYATLVHKAALRRRGAVLLEEAIPALAASENPLEAIAGVRDSLDELVSSGTSGWLISSDDLGAAYLDFLYGEAGQPIPTGLRSLDSFIKGFFSGRLYTIGARSGIGKSAFGLALAQLAAKKHRVLYLSTEMNGDELTGRVVASFSGVPYSDAPQVAQASKRDGASKQTLDKAAQIAEAMAQFGKLKFSIEANGRIALPDVSVLARQCKAELVVLDYLQQVTVPGNNSEYEKLTLLTGELKRLARSLNIPIISLAQLNRGAATEGAPGIHNLKGSGSIEQDSDVVLLIDRPEMGEKKPVEPFLVNVAKNRHGRTGTFKLDFAAATNRFIDEQPGKWHCASWA